jgi:hypothetical protein
MAKSKTSSADFARFLEDSDEPAAFLQSPNTIVETKTRAKVEPKLSPSAAKVEPRGAETRAKVEPKLSQNNCLKTQYAAKVEPQPEPQVEPILSQSAAKVEPNLSFMALVGLQRNALLLIYDSCRMTASKTSAPICIQNIVIALETTVAAARKALQRLEQKGYIARSSYKDGRGGWTQYRMQDLVYNALLINETRAKVEPKLSQTRAKVEPQPEPQPEPTPPSSSRVLILKNSTTTNLLDISTIDVGSIFQHGITSSVLLRCIELYPNLTLDQLEVLVARFAEFIKDPKNRVQNARGFFISLAEQASKGQVPLDHIETPDERLMREYVLQQEQAKHRRSELEQKAQEFEFETWAENLSSEDKLHLVPENSFLKLGTAPYKAMLKRHFVEMIWPERRQQIVQTAQL